MQKLEEHLALLPFSQQVLSVLQLRALNEPLLPNLTTLTLGCGRGDFIPFIPLLLSPKTTTIELSYLSFEHHRVAAASLITAFPTICPSLQNIRLSSLPRDPVITVAASGLLLSTSRNPLQSFLVDCPLNEEACEVIYKLPDLCELSTVVDRSASLPTMVLPNLTDIYLKFDNDPGRDWFQGFRGASLGRLVSVNFYSEIDSVNGVLEVFESVALGTSIPATLSTFRFFNPSRWTPNYRALLPFTQLKELVVEFSCEGGCPSTIDDDTITDLARTMPKLETLHIGESPCETTGGITIMGLSALAHYSPHLNGLRIHFQLDSLDPPEVPPFSSIGGLTPRQDCALTCLDVGDIFIPGESTLMVAMTLIRLFPHLEDVHHSLASNWDEVANVIRNSKSLVNLSSKERSPATKWDH